MTAIPAARRADAGGLRPVNPRRDLGGLADLIEIAFADSLDASGRQMAQEMRRFSRFGWLGWLVGFLFLPPAAYPLGYVYEIDGSLVGNASLLRVDGTPWRWVLANVAVRPAFRRRGIARRLVAASLDLAESRRAREIVLQVRADNLGALDLYRQFGFELETTRVSWRRGRSAPPGPAGGGRQRRPEEWETQLDLARRLTPAGLVWPHPLRPTLFRPAAFPSADRWHHWVWPEQGRMQAFLSARLEPGVSDLYLVAEPDAGADAGPSLLRQALSDPLVGRFPQLLETVGSSGEAAARDLGFAEVHRLTWMRRAGPRDAGQ